MKWILKHLRLVIVVVTVAVTAIIVSAVMISSYVSYKNYEKKYYANDLRNYSEFKHNDWLNEEEIPVLLNSKENKTIWWD